MNSHDLAEEILALPPHEVFVASDAEGNHIQPLAEYTLDYVVNDEGEFQAVDESDVAEYGDEAHKVIVIWPV